MGRNLFADDNKPKTNRPGRNLFADDKQESFIDRLPRNIAIGSANLANQPYEIAQTLKNVYQPSEKVKQKFPFLSHEKEPDISEKIHVDVPKFARMMGQIEEPTGADYLVQKGVEFGPELLFAGNAVRNIIPHLTRRGASRNLRRARQLGMDREIGPLNVNPEVIEDARQFLPNTLPYRNAINAAHGGDYQELFNLQSDLGKIANDYVRNIFSASERTHGRAGLQARNRLLDEIHTALEDSGHHDISNLLRQGRNEYRRYMRFKPYRNALALAGFGLAIPKNPITNLAKKALFHNNQ